MLLEVFSRDHGRVSLIAKGVKSKNKQNLQGLLQPYHKLKISWSGKSSLFTLNTAELLPPVNHMFGQRVMTGFYINELIMRLLHQNEPHQELFASYESTLDRLKQQNDEQTVLRKFEKELLQALGYGLVLDHDVESHSAIDNDLQYYYSLQNGPSIKPPKSGDYIIVRGETLSALENNQFENDISLKEARQLMRYILNFLLGKQPLLSRELYKSYLNVL